MGIVITAIILLVIVVIAIFMGDDINQRPPAVREAPREPTTPPRRRCDCFCHSSNLCPNTQAMCYCHDETE